MTNAEILTEAVQSGKLKPGSVMAPIDLKGQTLYGTWANGTLSLNKMTGPGQFTELTSKPVPTAPATGGMSMPQWFGGWDPNQPQAGMPNALVQAALGQWNPETQRFWKPLPQGMTQEKLKQMGFDPSDPNFTLHMGQWPETWSPTARPTETRSLAGLQMPPGGKVPAGLPWASSPGEYAFGGSMKWHLPGGQFPGAGTPGYNGGDPAGWRYRVDYPEPTGWDYFLGQLLKGPVGFLGSTAVGGAASAGLGALTTMFPALASIMNSPWFQALGTLSKLYGVGSKIYKAANKPKGPVV